MTFQQLGTQTLGVHLQNAALCKCTHTLQRAGITCALLRTLTMSNAEDVLVSFRAGLMNPENNSLKADQRKGSVQVVQVRASSGYQHCIETCSYRQALHYAVSRRTDTFPMARARWP